MLSKIKLICFFIILATLKLQAAIPSAQTILNRYTHNNGKGSFIIEQEVQFMTEADPIILKEKWIVENAEQMYLIVNSDNDKSHIEVLYKDKRRTFFDSNGSVKSASLSKEFTEPVLYYRTSKSLHEYLSQVGIFSNAMNFEKAPAEKSKQKFEYVRSNLDSFAQLSRVGGSIAYFFGEPTPTNQEKQNPGIWIEQDRFLLKKVRFPSQAEMNLDQQSNFTQGLILPRDRSIVWEGHTANIHVLSVKPLAAKANKPWFSNNYLTGRSGPQYSMKLPNQSYISDFYSRFR